MLALRPDQWPKLDDPSADFDSFKEIHNKITGELESKLNVLSLKRVDDLKAFDVLKEGAQGLELTGDYSANLGFIARRDQLLQKVASYDAQLHTLESGGNEFKFIAGAMGAINQRALSVSLLREDSVDSKEVESELSKGEAIVGLVARTELLGLLKENVDSTVEMLAAKVNSLSEEEIAQGGQPLVTRALHESKELKEKIDNALGDVDINKPDSLKMESLEGFVQDYTNTTVNFEHAVSNLETSFFQSIVDMLKDTLKGIAAALFKGETTPVHSLSGTAGGIEATRNVLSARSSFFNPPPSAEKAGVEKEQEQQADQQSGGPTLGGGSEE